MLPGEDDECVREQQYSPESTDQRQGEPIYTGGEALQRVKRRCTKGLIFANLCRSTPSLHFESENQQRRT
ncbi:hypothetical protein E2542_SST15906 [Spatholobus suberectus]|nr:hypothetical protein E2542_SST15906 [Spatholobus suberectus]